VSEIDGLFFNAQ